jgi:lipopolysaccharide/colanic/teichoic acid biosynthesis glycosyltransferase/NDP-sugar pyrophosphorylase family protein
MDFIQRIKDVIIVEEGQYTQLIPLANGFPVFMSPLFNKPLIGHTIDYLRKNGFENIVLSLPFQTPVPDYVKQSEREGGIRCYQEDRPRGSAGILKILEPNIGTSPFLVITSNLFLGKMDLKKFIAFHFKKKSMVTYGVNGGNNGQGINKNYDNVGAMNKGVSFPDRVSDDDYPWNSSNIFIFHPAVLSFINNKSYMDIKTQLIPALLKESLTVSPCEIEGFHLPIKTLNDYMNLHRTCLFKGIFINFMNTEEVAEGILREKHVQISPEAYLLGPMVIGEGSRIEGGAQIIGPVVVGNDCRISEGVLVRESILENEVFLSKDSKVEYSIIANFSTVPSKVTIKNALVVKGLKYEIGNQICSEYELKNIIDLSSIVSGFLFKRKLYSFGKRIMDLLLSAIGIVILFPLFILIAILIKLDSRGPVFYIQKRCGKNGKIFGMIKFRSMADKADKLQDELILLKETDGPMFKISQDPRITRLGRLLRKNSLDELPQLINVLKGEMSLVGPRPLITDEMRFSLTWRDIRLKVKPGITGLWQIKGRSDTSFHNWIKYDLAYVKNRSLWGDIKILFKTIRVVLKREGV